MTNDLGDDRLLLHALADQQLDAAAAVALERRIAADPGLASEYECIVAMKGAVGRLAKPTVRDDLRARIAALAAPRTAVAAPRKLRRPIWPSRDWQAIAASIVVTACIASGATYTLTRQADDISIEDAVASGHRRSLLAASPIDVASSDRHTVRPWFDAKLGVSPPTIDLAAAGFALVGGRVDVIAGRPVPSLVYRHHQHLITLLAIPAASDAAAPPLRKVADGYNMIQWTKDGFRYWAVSDLDANDLETFADKLTAR